MVGQTGRRLCRSAGTEGSWRENWGAVSAGQGECVGVTGEEQCVCERGRGETGWGGEGALRGSEIGLQSA